MRFASLGSGSRGNATVVQAGTTTLLIVPASFSLAVGVENWLGPRLRRILTNGGADSSEPVASKPAPAE